MASPFDQLEEQEAASSVSAEQAIPEWMKGGATPSFVTPGGMVNIPVSTLTAAAQAIPDKSPLEQIGVTPENIIPGTAAPKPLWPVTVPAAAAAKTAVGLAGAMTTPKGLLELGALFTPAAPAVSAKWIWDMVKGMGESGKDLLSKLKKLGTDPKSFSAEDIQATADDVVSFAAQAGGVKGLAGHQLGRLREWNARRMANLVDPTTGQKPFAELEQAEAETPETKTVAEAKPVLPLAAAEAEKGVTDATKERNVQESVLGERPGDDAQRAPAGPSTGGGVRPATPVAPEEVPRPESEQGRVLLKPKKRDVGKAFDRISRDDRESLLAEWAGAELSEDGQRILVIDKREGPSGNYTLTRSAFFDWLFSDEATKLSTDADWQSLLQRARDAAVPKTEPPLREQEQVLLKPDPIVAAAFKKSGRIFDARSEGGVTHMEADMAAEAAGVHVEEKDAGFITASGRFLTREEAYEHAKGTQQLIQDLDTFDEGKLHTGKMPSYETDPEAAPLFHENAEGKHFIVMQGSGEIHIFENQIAAESFKVANAEKDRFGRAELDERIGKPGETVQDVLRSASRVVGKGKKQFKPVYHQEKPDGTVIEVDLSEQKAPKTEPAPPVTEPVPRQPVPTVAAPEGEPVVPVSAGTPPGIPKGAISPPKEQVPVAIEQLSPREMLSKATADSDLMASMAEHLKAIRAAMKQGSPISAAAARSYQVLPEIVKAPKPYRYDPAKDMFIPAESRMAVSKDAWKTIAALDALDLRQKEVGETPAIDAERTRLTAKLSDQLGFRPDPVQRATTDETKTTPAPEPAQPAAPATTPTVGTPPPATPAAGATAAPSPLAHGIRQESREALAAAGKQAPNVPGVGVAPDAAILKGEQLNAANPGLAQKLLTDFETALAAANGDISKVGVSEQMFTVTRAHGRELLKAAEQAEQQFGPTSPQYQAAWNTFSDWQARTKPMHTAWHSAGQAQQMEVDVNTGTVTGLNQVSQGATGKALPASSVPKANIIAKKNANAEKAAQQAVFNAHRRIAVAAAEADRKGRVTGVKEKTALAKVEADAKQKALDAAQKVTFKAAERLANAEKAAQVAKSAAEKKAAEAERRRAQKEVDKQSVRTRKAASDLAKAERKALADPIGTVWTKAREIIDRQPADSGMMDPSDLVNRISEETGMSPERVARTLAQDKRTKYLMDDAWKKQLIARNLRTQAKVWAATRNIEPYKRALSKIPRLMFSLKVGLHGTVALGTHVPMVAFQPTFWKTYVRDFGKMYKMIAQPAYHQMQMDNLVRRNSWVTARRAGLVNDPFQFEDYNSPQTTISFGRLTGMGNRGYSVLKIIRQDMFDQHFDRLPDRLQKIPEVAAEIANNVNHATGVVKGRAPKGTNIALFAPRLEASRVMWLLGDPLKAADTFVSWTRATEAEKWFAKQVLKERAWVLGTMSGLLALNQGFLKAVDSEQSINWDNPMKSDWLKFKVGGLNMGYGNAMISMARLPERMALAIVNEGKFSNIVFEDENVYKIIGSYARSQASPFAGTLLDLGFGRDYAERPLPRAGYGFLEGKTNIPRRLRAQGITEPYSWVEYGAKTAAFIPLQEGLVEGWQAMEDVWDGMGLPPEEQKRLAKALVIISLMAGTGARVTEDVPY